MTIKPELQQEYDKYVEVNKQDEYSYECILSGERVGDALDQGKSADEALQAMDGYGITGFMAGMAVNAVARFHPRGDEVRLAWNKLYGVPETEERVVNPAFIEMMNEEVELLNEDEK